jgi:hypothetical protein
VAAPRIPVYLEVGKKRVFAGAVDWPGWCRSGRDEETALGALVPCGPRFRKALRRAASGFEPPADGAALRVVERLEGNATTDFGAPGQAPAADERPLDEAEAKLQAAILRVAWAAFDRTAKASAGAKLRKGPRGGGRELDAIVRHVLDAEGAYLAKLGGPYRKPMAAADVWSEMAGLRRATLGLLSSLARGEPPPRTPRSGSLWTPRYFVRRSAWHALDHAWEIEDRSAPPHR